MVNKRVWLKLIALTAMDFLEKEQVDDWVSCVRPWRMLEDPEQLNLDFPMVRS